jgi:hypothetical protein
MTTGAELIGGDGGFAGEHHHHQYDPQGKPQ